MVSVAVLGASGGIGQPLSLLMKINPLVSHLSLYDVVGTPGVTADLSHISTGASTRGFLKPDDGLKKALDGVDVVIIPAGIPRKPGMSRDDLFKINAGIIRELATGIAETCPKASVLVISNPVNSTVPIVAEVFKQKGTFDPRKLFGVTTLDIVRASTFVAEVLGEPSSAPRVTVPVIGGHSGVTILPLLSQSSPPLPPNLEKQKLEELTHRIRFGGDEVVKAKDGAGSATLSMAYAGAQFAEKIIKALKGEQGIVTQSYVYLGADKGGEAAKNLVNLDYFSVPVELGTEGIKAILPIGALSEYEQSLLKEAIPELKDSIAKGVNFANPAQPSL